MLKRAALIAAVLALSVPAARAVVVTYETEADFLAALDSAGLTAVHESFDGPAWDGVRTFYPDFQTAPAITSHGVTWTGRPGNAVTTNTNWGRSGFGIFEYQIVGFSASELFGTTDQPIYAVGLFVSSNPIYGDMSIEVNGQSSNPILVTDNTFIGLIDLDGLTSFRVYDFEGEHVWGADDAVFGVSTPLVPADLNGDGVVSGPDLALMLAAWGVGSGPADLDGDGAVGGSDLAILLAAWG